MELKPRILILYLLLWMIFINSEAICYKKSGMNSGVANILRCGDPSSTGRSWCSTTKKCLEAGSDELCPECDYQDAKQYCAATDECCDSCNCIDVSRYTSGVPNTAKCGDAGSTGYLYCKSTGECLPPGSGSTCPVCRSGKQFCKLLGGGQCCDDCPVIDTAVRSISEYLEIDSREGYCFRKSGMKQGTANVPKCGDPGSTGMTFCDTTQKCLNPGDLCPECKYDEANQYCQRTDECCSYDCTQQTCESASDYNKGVRNRLKCRGSGELYCKSTGECLFARAGVVCPVCSSSRNTEWCSLLGGGQCCNYCTDTYGSVAVAETENKLSERRICYKKSGMNSGIANIPQCGDPGSTGMRWCETTQKCLEPGSDELCPECGYDKAGEYCIDTDECCNSCNINTCTDPIDYSEGVKNRLKCRIRGELYCKSKDECLSSGSGVVCPVCPSGKKWCSLLGGGQCCVDCNELGSYQASKTIETEYEMIETAKSGSTGGYCFKKSGKKQGTANVPLCGDPGSTGMTYCDTTKKCLNPGDLCPECEYNEANIYCESTEECCNYDCTQIPQTCEDPDYNEGVKNRLKCRVSGELYCKSTGECLAAGSGVVCPVCPSSGNTKVCQFLGGKQCCNFCAVNSGVYSAATPIKTETAYLTTETVKAGGQCFSKTGANTGTANVPECGDPGSTGMRYCDTTKKCLAPGSDELCPECGYDEANQYCIDTDLCCDYDCNIPSCSSAIDYTKGVKNKLKCRKKGELYCESKDECLARDSGVVCPVCASGTKWCSLLGGGQCCDDCDKLNVEQANSVKTVYMPRYVKNGHHKGNNMAFKYHDVIVLLCFAVIAFLALAVGIFIGKKMKKPAEKMVLDDIDDI